MEPQPRGRWRRAGGGGPGGRAGGRPDTTPEISPDLLHGMEQEQLTAPKISLYFNLFYFN